MGGTGVRVAAEDFFAAVEAGDQDRVRAMLDTSPKLVEEYASDGASVPLLALYAGHPALADELAARKQELSVFEAAAFDDTERLGELIQADRSVIADYSPDGWQALHLAAFFGRSEAARLLLDADAAPDEPSTNQVGIRPLGAAAAGGHTEMVWILIASEAEVDAVQPGGWTALMSAASRGDVDSVRALLAAGADASLRNDDGAVAAELTASGEVRDLLEANSF